MAIIASEIKYYLSGGSANTNPNASLGGVISSTEVPSNGFDDVSSSEASAGSIEYRCIYVKNTNATLTLIGAKAYISANTPSATTNVDIGLGSSAVNGTEQTVGSETTAPTGVSFSAPSSLGTGLSIGDLAPNATKAIWIKRTVNAGTASVSDSFTVAVGGDSNP